MSPLALFLSLFVHLRLEIRADVIEAYRRALGRRRHSSSMERSRITITNAYALFAVLCSRMCVCVMSTITTAFATIGRVAWRVHANAHFDY